MRGKRGKEMVLTHGWWMLSETLFWVAFLGLVVWIVASLARNPDSETHGRHAAVAILEDRFARGDISVDEFRERRTEIEHTPRRR